VVGHMRAGIGIRCFSVCCQRLTQRMHNNSLQATRGYAYFLASVYGHDWSGSQALAPPRAPELRCQPPERPRLDKRMHA